MKIRHGVWIALFSLVSISCKPKNNQSQLNAVSNEDGTISYAILPVRSYLESTDLEKIKKMPYAMTAFQSLVLAPVLCEGPTAKIDIILLENAYISQGTTLVRKGNDLFQNASTGLLKVNRCQIYGESLGGSASLISLLSGSLTSEKQAVYLGIRGPTSLGQQVASPVLYELMSENLGVVFKGIEQYANLSQELDAQYNPCIEDSTSGFNKYSSVTCDADGNYTSKDIKGDLQRISKFFKTSEEQYVKQQMPADQDALRLYTAVTQVDGKLADVSADLDPLSILRVFGGRKSLKSDDRWFVDEGFTLGQTAGSPIGVSHPLDGSPGWRQHSYTSFTKDGISFYEKSKAGKFSRIVLSSYNQLYVLSPKSNKSKMLLRSKIFTDSFALSLAPPTDQASANTKPTEPKYDSRPTAFSKEQGPPLDQAVKAYRSGKASDEDVSNAFHAATRHLPFGKKSVDPWTDKHNCVDIAMATCRAMYPIMPKGTAVGHLGVSNKLGAGHSVNYFSFRDKDGKHFRNVTSYAPWLLVSSRVSS